MPRRNSIRTRSINDAGNTIITTFIGFWVREVITSLWDWALQRLLSRLKQHTMVTINTMALCGSSWSKTTRPAASSTALAKRIFGCTVRHLPDNQLHRSVLQPGAATNTPGQQSGLPKKAQAQQSPQNLHYRCKSSPRSRNGSWQFGPHVTFTGWNYPSREANPAWKHVPTAQSSLKYFPRKDTSARF